MVLVTFLPIANCPPLTCDTADSVRHVFPEPMKEPKFRFEIKPPIAIATNELYLLNTKRVHVAPIPFHYGRRKVES